MPGPKDLLTINDYIKNDDRFYRIIPTVSGISPEGKYEVGSVKSVADGFEATLDTTLWGGNSLFIKVTDCKNIEEVFKYLDGEIEKFSEKNNLYVENSRHIAETPKVPETPTAPKVETKTETKVADPNPPRDTTTVIFDAAKAAVGQEILTYMQNQIMKRVKSLLFKQFPALELADNVLVDRIAGTVSVAVIHWALKNHADKIPGLKKEWQPYALYAAELAIQANMNQNAGIIMEYVVPLLMDLGEFGKALMEGDPSKVTHLIEEKEDADLERELKKLEREKKMAMLVEAKKEKVL